MRKLLLLVFGILLIGSVLGAVTNLGIFKQGDCIELPQACTTCTYNNISKVYFPNQSAAVGTETTMTKSGNQYNYTFCNTNAIGEYLINGHGDLDGTDTTWNYGFEVNYLGQRLSTGGSILYFILILVLIFVFVLVLLGIAKLPNQNDTNEEGNIVEINQLKYLRSVLWFFEWIFIIAILFLSSNLAFAFLQEQLFAKAVFLLFQICLVLTPLIVIVWFVWIFVKIIQDKKLRALFERGIFPHSKT